MSAQSGYDPEFDAAPPKPLLQRRFTLIEFLVILAIMAMLIVAFLPVTRSAGEAARRSQCVNNLKQIALALHNYEQTYHALPPACTVDASGRPLHSWRTLILPYLEQEPLYRTIDLSKPWDDPANAKTLGTTLNVYHCPSSQAPDNRTTYLAIVAPEGCFRPGVPRRLEEITDDQNNTLAVIEAADENAVPWMAPRDADEALVLRLGRASKTHHSGGMNAGSVDGSVHFLRSTTPADVRRALISIAGGDDKFAGFW